MMYFIICSLMTYSAVLAVNHLMPQQQLTLLLPV